MIDVNEFSNIRIGLATADDIRMWSNGEVKNLRLSTIEHLSLKKMAFFVRRFLVPPKIGNATAGNIKESDLRELFVNAVVLK